MASTSTAVLMESPKRGVDGIYRARLRLNPHGFQAVGRCFSPGGDWFPYFEGDAVRVQVVHDDPSAGIHITGLVQKGPALESSSNREIHARGNGDLVLRSTEGKTRLGAGPSSDQKPVAIHEEVEGDTQALSDVERVLVEFMLIALAPLGTSAGAFTTKMQAVCPGMLAPLVPGPELIPHEVPPTANPAENVTAKPEDGPIP